MSRKLATKEDRERKRKVDREWRRRKWADDPEYRAKKTKINRAWESRIRAEIVAYKLEHGCSRCGYDRCSAALQFHHHSGDKKFDIGARMDCGRQKIWAEIAKCDLVCANCHAEIHHGDAQASTL